MLKALNAGAVIREQLCGLHLRSLCYCRDVRGAVLLWALRCLTLQEPMPPTAEGHSDEGAV